MLSVNKQHNLLKKENNMSKLVLNRALRNAILTHPEFGSQKEFALTIGMHESKLSKIINGQDTILTADEKKIIAETLNIPVKKLFKSGK